MIGVLAGSNERDIVREFFELFKTPYEFADDTKTYDVMVCTSKEIAENNAKLILIYSADQTEWDRINNVSTKEISEPKVVSYSEIKLPVYGKLAKIECNKRSDSLDSQYSNTSIHILKLDNGNQVVRLGYDLFSEIDHILSNGQSERYADIPTIDLHISMLRNWIIDAGLPLIEIPPVPAGYDFICCLTHDVDFAGIRNHLLDRTMFGFLYRAVFKTLLQFFQGQRNSKKLLKNWSAALKLPFIYLGIADDFWMQFGQYRKIEKQLKSTFFFIPYKHLPGKEGGRQAPRSRGCKYDIEQLQQQIKALIEDGCEVGLHGIDAWRDTERAKAEKERIRTIAGNEKIGVRMHWLYFGKDTARVLEKADFYYDSSLGFNDAVGFRNGTTQPFRFGETNQVMELPLNIQDTSMFYPDRMGLTEEKAFEDCKNIIDRNEKFGGVLVINWHHRSIAPERLWDSFYIKLIEEIKNCRVWFDTCAGGITWFKNRSSIQFRKIEVLKDKVRIELSDIVLKNQPEYRLRIYLPKMEKIYDLPFGHDESYRHELSLSE